MRHIEENIRIYEDYFPTRTKREDFEEFWKTTLAEVSKRPLQEEKIEINYPIKEIVAYKIYYYGFDHTPIKGYYLLPRNIQQPIPCLILYHGYNGHKGSIAQYMHWVIQGYAVIAVDCRDQGETGDYSDYTTGSLGSWVTKGILNKTDYYYRKVYVDCLRAIDFACNQAEVDTDRIGIMGASMGGGITLAVAALDHRPKLAVADIPNMCDIELAIALKMEGSLTFVDEYLKRNPSQIKQVFETLSYFDNLNLAEWIQCRIRMSVGLKDFVCPAKTIYGVYNHIMAPKELVVYPFSGHDVFNVVDHIDQTIGFVREYL